MSNQGNILVTGSNSGLGKQCCEFFNAIPFNRQTSFSEILKKGEEEPFSAIIHAAFNTKPDVDSTQLYAYLNDTILLTKKLLQVPHKKFIFISTVDVYPADDKLHYEDEVLNFQTIRNIYSVSKIISESLVQNESNNHLILRTTALLGAYAKPNSLIKILTQDNPKITLSEQSEFNYIRHIEVCEFIRLAMANDWQGIYNLAASSNVTIGEVSSYFQRKAMFGNYVYRTAKVSNSKALSVFDKLKNTSLDNINLFQLDLSSSQ